MADPKNKTEQAEHDRDDEMLDEALEDSFPASDPPSMTQPKSKAGAPAGKTTHPEQAKHRESDVDTGKAARTGNKGT